MLLISQYVGSGGVVMVPVEVAPPTPAPPAPPAPVVVVLVPPVVAAVSLPPQDAKKPRIAARPRAAAPCRTEERMASRLNGLRSDVKPCWRSAGVQRARRFFRW